MCIYIYIYIYVYIYICVCAKDVNRNCTDLDGQFVNSANLDGQFVNRASEIDVDKPAKVGQLMCHG